jgi:flagellar biosynthesis/type III secretory pathway chaperone
MKFQRNRTMNVLERTISSFPKVMSTVSEYWDKVKCKFEQQRTSNTFNGI